MNRLLGDDQPETGRPAADASGAGEEVSRTARKRRAILNAAIEVFLEHGYVGASMDEVAARAAVSKQTVYKQFEDKEHLFASIILGTTSQGVDGFRQAYEGALEAATDVRLALRNVAQYFVDALMQPDFLKLRRLVLAEADRFPDVSGAWFERAFNRALEQLGESIARLADRGLLRDVSDPTLAAYQFAGLVMYKPLNQAMFAGTEARPAADELGLIADQAVDVFLSAYGPRGGVNVPPASGEEESYADLLQQAIRLAVDNAEEGRAPFGAIVVLDGQVVGSGVNTCDQDIDPTAHAEVAAIRDACRRLGRQDLTGAVVVASCEPCAMCHLVCAVTQVSRLVYAAPREYVPADGTPRPDLVLMQDTLRGLAPDRIVHIPAPGADEPFARYVERLGGVL